MIQQVCCWVLRTINCLPSPILMREDIVWRINLLPMIRTNCAPVVPYSMVYLVNSLYYGRAYKALASSSSTKKSSHLGYASPLPFTDHSVSDLRWTPFFPPLYERLHSRRIEREMSRLGQRITYLRGSSHLASTTDFLPKGETFNPSLPQISPLSAACHIKGRQVW